MNRRLLFILLIVLLQGPVYSWNATGHRLIAQIAYDQLTPEAKQWVKKHSQRAEKKEQYSSFVAMSTWLDKIRVHEVHWYDGLHYIDLPFSTDETPLPQVQKVNALWGIKEALANLNAKYANKQDKALSLKILTHVIGDIHQPLHTASLVNAHYPEGDLGGNLFYLGQHALGKNLHQYWDNGGGMLLGLKTAAQIKNKAHQLEHRWPCSIATQIKTPKEWIDASHQLAVMKAYHTRRGEKPSKDYQLVVQNISEKQILLAGCRLGWVLNQLV